MRYTPRATYRLQLLPGLGFEGAIAVTDYLAALGVSHLYLSPCLEAVAGSTHGYDVVDPTRVSAALGGEEGLRALARTAAERNMSLLVDIVPNHLAADAANPWWWSTLAHGPASPDARVFDVDWWGEGGGRLVVATLGDHLGRVLDRGEARLERAGARLVVRYHEKELPVEARSTRALLRRAARRASGEAEASGAALEEIAAELRALPGPFERDAGRVALRRARLPGIEERLAATLREDPRAAAALDAVVAELNERPAVLAALLSRQPYRLAHWRVERFELTHRRFFDIDTLVGVRQEDPEVFQRTHARILRAIADGDFDGVRIDHVDGLRKPTEYLRRLREAAPESWIVVEKILQTDELPPRDWPIDGTTGYELMDLAGGVLMHPAGERRLEELRAQFTGRAEDFREVERRSKRRVVERMFGSEVSRFARRLRGLARRALLDLTLPELEDAVGELLASLPIYRTYLAEDVASARDVRVLEGAFAEAREHRADLGADVFDFLEDVLLLRRGEPGDVEAVLDFQQISPAVMAKGVEDTALYAHTRQIARNEVGADPDRFAISLEAFHAALAERPAGLGGSLFPLSSHDSKRSGDVRARLALLAEIPDRWREAVDRWAARNERHRRDDVPDHGAEYLLYQTLVGAWPISTARVLAYMEKASREAKLHTSWRRPEPRYETALRAFVEGALGDEEFTADLAAFVEPLVEPGRRNSLSQTALQLTAWGVPDLYQGSERWDLSLVDPDNRRPVDFDGAARLLAELERAGPEEALARSDEGAPKLWLVRRALALRARRPEAFGPGASYAPLRARGERADHVVAFARGERVVTVAPRWPIGLAQGWGDTALELPAGRWRSALDGAGREGEVPLSELAGRFPVEILELP